MTQEFTSDQVLRCTFASDWIKKWREFSGPIAQWREEKNKAVPYYLWRSLESCSLRHKRICKKTWKNFSRAGLKETLHFALASWIFRTWMWLWTMCFSQGLCILCVTFRTRIERNFMPCYAMQASYVTPYRNLFTSSVFIFFNYSTGFGPTCQIKILRFFRLRFLPKYLNHGNRYFTIVFFYFIIIFLLFVLYFVIF